MALMNECEICGAALDPDEKCDCGGGENLPAIRCTQPPIIVENLDSVRQNLEILLADISTLPQNDDSLKYVKQIRANLSKEFEQIEIQRKAVKRQVMEPYDRAEQKYKQYISSPYKEADEQLKKWVDDYQKESLFLSAGGESARARAATDKELLSIGIGPGEYHGITLALVEETRHVTETLYKKYLPGRPLAPYDYKKVFRYCGSSGRAVLLDYAFERATLAGKSGDWRYVDGIMDTLFCRGITTEEQAHRWDEERPDLDI